MRDHPRTAIYRVIVLAVTTGLLAPPAHADIAVVLKKSFIDKYSDRATIEVSYSVADVHAHAKPDKDDGDIHCSGSPDDIGLACVAEIVHANTQPEALKHLVDAKGQNPVPLVGVWRIWPEHPNGGQDFIQGQKPDPITNTNPPHIFEIHPLVEVDGVDVRGSFTRVPGYTYKKDTDAFPKYENQPCELHEHRGNVTLVTKQLGYNYVRFTARLLEDPTHTMEDGNRSVYVEVPSSNEEEPLASKVRCIFITGTPPEQKLEHLHAGDEIKLLGVPRVDLALVRYRIEHASQDSSLLTRSLPYELAIVGLGN